MIKSSTLFLGAVLAIVAGLPGLAQDQSIAVGKLPEIKRVWGDQIVEIPVTNNTPDVRFVVVLVRTVFTDGTYLNPERVNRTNAIVDPSARTTIPAPVVIPPNWGAATITISIYDVIDTVDVLSLGTRLLEQPFMLRFRLPQSLNTIMQERLTLAPGLENSPLFDNEFTRLLCRLLHEGKNLADVAGLCEAETTMVMALASDMSRKGFLATQGKSPKPTFSYIESKTAEAGRLLADSLAAELTSLVKKNLPAFHAMRDSLKMAGKVAADSLAFMDGGSVLYYPSPVVGMFLLWLDLGQRFISRGERLLLFMNTDPCMAQVPAYTYLVEGGDMIAGTHFFKYDRLGKTRVISWADTPPRFLCPEDFRYRTTVIPLGDWGYDPGRKPESFMFNAAAIEPALRVLSEGTPSYLMKADSSFNTLMATQGTTAPTPADRYWFWNLVATKTLRKLDKDGVIPQQGNGFFRFTELQ